MRRVLIYSSTYTQGQVGVLLYTSGVSDEDYLNRIDVQTTSVDIGVRLQSAAGIQNGSNSSWVSAACQGHTVCVDIPSGTDSWVTGTADNAYNPGTGANGIGIRCGGAGTGNYGCATNHLGPFTSEQGGTSTTIAFLPGATSNYYDIMSNDASNVSDTSGGSSGFSTNRGINGGYAFNFAWVGVASGSTYQGYYEIQNTSGSWLRGYTGTKTAGSCTLTIEGGIITSVTGC